MNKQKLLQINTGYPQQDENVVLNGLIHTASKNLFSVYGAKQKPGSELNTACHTSFWLIKEYFDNKGIACLNFFSNIYLKSSLQIGKANIVWGSANWRKWYSEPI